MKAVGNWVQIKEKEHRGFLVANSSLLEGEIISVGDNAMRFKKGDTVLFPAVHGKVMEHSIAGVKFYFVDNGVVLAYE